MKKFIFHLALVLSFGLFPSNMILAEESHSKISSTPFQRGKWWLGGSAYFPIELGVSRPWLIKAVLSPEIGNFAVDNFLILVKPFFQTTFFASRPKTLDESIIRWGVQLEGRSFFSLSSQVFFFMGFGLGVELSQWIPDTGILKAEIPLGVFIALNPSTGISIGAPFSFLFTTRSIFEKAVWTPGYLGVNGVF